MANYSSNEIKSYVDNLSKNLSGEALHNKIYEDAKAKGVSGSQLESAMGWGSGTVSKWAQQNNKEGLLSSAVKPTAPSLSPSTTQPHEQATNSNSDYTGSTPSVLKSGQMGLELKDGKIQNLAFYGKDGETLSKTAFNAPAILDMARRFNVDISDLKGIGTQLDGWGIGYRPYEQYKGTGSNHGIDIDDLIAGGMGTAYDWTQDSNLHLKGETGRAALMRNQALARDLGIKRTEGVTDASSGNVDLLGSNYKSSYRNDPRFYGNTPEEKENQAASEANDVYGQSNSRETYSNSGSPAVRRINPLTETVEGRLGGLLSRQNPMMERAYYKGLDQANSRGLLNSSMSSEAAQAALIDAALPIAKFDASVSHDQSKVNQGYINQFGLNDKVYQQNAEQAALNRSHDFALEDARFGYNARQADLNRQHESLMGRQSTENAIKKGSYDVTANTQGAYLPAIDKITNNAAVSINEIETSQNIPQAEKDKMIANTVARRNADLEWTKKLYSSMPTWDMSWINLESMPSAPGIA